MQMLARTSQALRLAMKTADAYAFDYYGLKRWTDCCTMLLGRGYNPIEVECVMRSRFTRFAADERQNDRLANATDLAYLMDERCGGSSQLQHYIDETVLAQMTCEDDANEPVAKRRSKDALRLAWSR
jgi:hypothetical protein